MPHLCPHCDYSTRRNNNLERHILTKHIKRNTTENTPEIFSCTLCSKTFSTKGNCKKHEQKCCINNKTIRNIIPFSLKISDYNEAYLELQMIYSNMSIQHTKMDIILKSIITYMNHDEYRNIYITSIRSKICYTLAEEGIWNITDKEYALCKKTTEFIEYMGQSIKKIDADNKTFTNFKKIWYDSFGKNRHDSKLFNSIKSLLEIEIYNYTKNNFPDGKFKHIPCMTILQEVDKPLTMKEEHVFDSIFGFID